MRRRTQAELDELVQAAGFCKLDQYIDDWGMFTVSIAQKEKPRKENFVALPEQYEFHDHGDRTHAVDNFVTN